ncbi:alpha/beta hydrolase (plasmid) [Streptomyces sp. NBC_01387]|uniref:alpha/beta fold hydrolase n=1 Tax=unclassified Streptomyces TaxID=2593676 RepID=UPI00225A3304|nr:alpha/beta hydrolase [Streptomyces sp. NBC_01500]MCX4554429.1 alpha/beta hydrolase [Streptomyces sp. NBC_01500]WSV58931.1 alpha/beta hydrolase [Streptomyces sp. NBC_01014]
MPFLTVKDGTQLFYNDWGTGRPVVFLGTAMMNSRMWEFQAPRLAQRGLRCITYDRRGFGRSDRPWEGYDYDTLADDLAGLIDHLGLREITLVGYAMGGGEAVRYLSRHGSGRVARLALVSSTTPYLMRAPDNPDGLDLAVFEQIADGMTRDRARFVAELTGPFFGGPGADPQDLPISSELAHWLAQTALDSSPRASVEVYRTLFTEDLREDVRGVDLPTLIVHGDGDMGAPFELCARKTAPLIPGSRLVVYEGAAHGLFATHADRLNEELLAFAGA